MSFVSNRFVKATWIRPACHNVTRVFMCLEPKYPKYSKDLQPKKNCNSFFIKQILNKPLSLNRSLNEAYEGLYTKHFIINCYSDRSNTFGQNSVTQAQKPITRGYTCTPRVAGLAVALLSHLMFKCRFIFKIKSNNGELFPITFRFSKDATKY